MATGECNETFTTPSELEIVMTRVVDAPRSLVFPAWTSPEHVPTAEYLGTLA